MNVFLIADTHFNHHNILKYCSRPFNSADEMGDVIIKNWNKKVKKTDTIFHLGDFCMGGINSFTQYANSLNGFINIVPGGHDKWIDEFDFIKFPNIRILPPIAEIDVGIKIGKHSSPIVLCHFPLLSWNRSFHGAYHAFGHEHGRLVHPNKHAYDVGVDVWNFTPVAIDEFIDKVKD